MKTRYSIVFRGHVVSTVSSPEFARDELRKYPGAELFVCEW